MDLFLETPQQQAERMLRQQQRLMEIQMQGAAVQPFAQNVVPAAVPAAVPGCESAPEAYSVQQDSYAQELAFDKRRARRRRAGQRLRTLAMIVLIPLACGHLFGVVCPHVHPQRRIAQRGAPTSSGSRPAPRRCRNNHSRRLGELAFVTLGLLGCRDYRHEWNPCILWVLSCD